jgi:hypothetical protein
MNFTSPVCPAGRGFFYSFLNKLSNEDVLPSFKIRAMKIKYLFLMSCLYSLNLAAQQGFHQFRVKNILAIRSIWRITPAPDCCW